MKRTQRTHESWMFLLFISPWLIGFLAFTLYPIISSLVISFTSWDIITPAKWIGLANYREMLADDRAWQALTNTTYYAIIGVPLTLILGFLLALLVNQKLKGIVIFRSIYYLPCVLSGVATALLWKWMFNPMIGLINHYLSYIGIKGLAWLSDPVWAKPAVVMYKAWFIGTTMMIFLSGLQAISPTLYEAAEVDGASRSQRFWRITLPLMTPSIFVNLLTGVIGYFQIFNEVYIMVSTTGDDYTRPFMQYIYMKAFNLNQMGYASALGWLLFAVIFILTLAQLSLQRKWVYQEVER